MTDASVTGLYIYPVKGCRGIAVRQARTSVRGLVVDSPAHPVGDREWMIVDAAGRFVTQREVPRLALVETAIASDALRLSIEGMPALAVPLAAPAGSTREVVVWNSTVPAHDAGAAPAAWLSSALHVDARLVRFDATHERRCNPDYAGDSGAHTAFADAYPLLVAGNASLADLNERLAATGSVALPMNRFRPNVVIEGLPAYDEDHLEAIEIGGVVLRPVKRCTRCITTTTDQSTAVRGAEPLRTLGGYRHDEALGGVTFGMNAIFVAGIGHEIVVGMPARCTYAF